MISTGVEATAGPRRGVTNKPDRRRGRLPKKQLGTPSGQGCLRCLGAWHVGLTRECTGRGDASAWRFAQGDMLGNMPTVQQSRRFFGVGRIAQAVCLCGAAWLAPSRRVVAKGIKTAQPHYGRAFLVKFCR